MRQFLVKWNLAPCKKKNCQFFPIKKLEGQNQDQYLCLICFKKMCPFFCGKQSANILNDNLTRHANKKHLGKSIYLEIGSSKIVIKVSRLIVFCDQTLYQNIIGEEPVKGTYGSQYYQNFKLNQKAIDTIVDIILGEKYLHKIFANIVKTIKIYLMLLYVQMIILTIIYKLNYSKSINK